jgi:hypothetical protein
LLLGQQLLQLLYGLWQRTSRTQKKGPGRTLRTLGGFKGIGVDKVYSQRTGGVCLAQHGRNARSEGSRIKASSWNKSVHVAAEKASI